VCPKGQYASWLVDSCRIFTADIKRYLVHLQGQCCMLVGMGKPILLW
jgi:hypothetical protein